MKEVCGIVAHYTKQRNQALTVIFIALIVIRNRWRLKFHLIALAPRHAHVRSRSASSPMLSRHSPARARATATPPNRSASAITSAGLSSPQSCMHRAARQVAHLPAQAGDQCRHAIARNKAAEIGALHGHTADRAVQEHHRRHAGTLPGASLMSDPRRTLQGQSRAPRAKPSGCRYGGLQGHSVDPRSWCTRHCGRLRERWRFNGSCAAGSTAR